MFLCWFSRMCLSYFLTGFAHCCVFLSTVVFRAVRGCGLFHRLSFSICNKSLQQFSKVVPSKYPTSKSYAPLCISEIALECLLCITHCVQWWDAIHIGYSLCTQGLQSLRGGGARHIPQQTHVVQWALWWREAQDMEELHKRASKLSLEQPRQRLLDEETPRPNLETIEGMS